MIAGPTASGKSQLAVDLACQLDGEVINADSMQLYADLSILSARPSKADMQDIPHHLYGVLDGGYRASVAAWLELAATAMTAIWARGKMPIIIGGTGMYLDAAVNGIAPIPVCQPISMKIAWRCLMPLAGRHSGKSWRFMTRWLRHGLTMVTVKG